MNGRVSRISGWPGTLISARAMYSPGGKHAEPHGGRKRAHVGAPRCRASTLTSGLPFSASEICSVTLARPSRFLIGAGQLEHRRHRFVVDHGGRPRPWQLAGGWRLRDEHEVGGADGAAEAVQACVDRVVHAAAAAGVVDGGHTQRVFAGIEHHRGQHQARRFAARWPAPAWTCRRD